MIALFVIGWLACGFFASGFLYAHLQRMAPFLADMHRSEDKAAAYGVMILGPLGLFAVLLSFTFVHGWLMPGRKP